MQIGAALGSKLGQLLRARRTGHPAGGLRLDSGHLGHLQRSGSGVFFA